MPEPYANGSQQSPIKIDVSTTVPVVYPLDYLVVDYPNTELAGHLKHDNDNFYFDVPPTIQFNGVIAPLERIHIHHKSEHSLVIGGQEVFYDYEIHFVHPLPNPFDPTSETGPSTNVVFGVFFKISANATTPKSIRSLNEAIRARVGANKVRLTDSDPPVTADINPLDFMPKNRSQFFRYEGSLTTPHKDQTPNPERVSWFVYPHLIEVAQADVEFLVANTNETARCTQPLNRRFVLRNFS